MGGSCDYCAHKSCGNLARLEQCIICDEDTYNCVPGICPDGDPSCGCVKNDLIICSTCSRSKDPEIKMKVKAARD
ncbi:hypothetical protein HDV00_000468 [Rhizophlyctis rosea]|nr:hypothetical protein HDV00_000468 [Rhizophlyctis rosea]